jgi:uncharacterized protein
MNKEDIIEYLALHKKEFQEKYGVTRIGLFGSYIRGNENEDSDIDIAVEMESENKFRSFFNLKRDLEKNLGEKVDLGILSTLKPIAKEYILKEIVYA